MKEASQPDFEKQFSALTELLACPACHGELRLMHARLVCGNCARGYAVIDGIPVLIADQA